MTAELRWSVTAAQIDAFAELSGDFNPLHVDAGFAKARGFADRVAHGLLLGSKVSTLMGMVLPGRDCLLLEVQLSWPKPVYPGDEILLTSEVVELSEEQKLLRVKIKAVTRRDAQMVTVGRGAVLCQVQY